MFNQFPQVLPYTARPTELRLQSYTITPWPISLAPEPPRLSKFQNGESPITVIHDSSPSTFEAVFPAAESAIPLDIEPWELPSIQTSRHEPPVIADSVV